MATRYHFVDLKPASDRFGGYDEGLADDAGHHDLQEMVTDAGAHVDLYELGVDELPEGVEDIRGRIYAYAGAYQERVAVYAVMDRGGWVTYQSVVATEEPVSAAGSEE